MMNKSTGGKVSRRAPLNSEDVAMRTVQEAKIALSASDNAVEQPLNITQLELALQLKRQIFQDHQENINLHQQPSSQPNGNNIDYFDEEVQKSVLKLQDKVQEAENAVFTMGKEIDTILRVSSLAGHQLSVLERQLSSVKERRSSVDNNHNDPIFVNMTSTNQNETSSDSSSNQMSGNRGGGNFDVLKKKLNEADHGILRAKRLLDELRGGVTETPITLESSKTTAMGDTPSLRPVDVVLMEVLQDTSVQIEEADSLVEAEVIRAAVEEGARTSALMRLNEITMTLQGINATAEASGYEVQSLVETDLESAKQAVQSCYKIIENPPDMLQHLSKILGPKNEASSSKERGGHHHHHPASSSTMTQAMEDALNNATDAIQIVEKSVEISVEQVRNANHEMRKYRDKVRKDNESAQILGERSIRYDVHRSTSCITALKQVDIAIAMFQRCSQVDVFEFLRDGRTSLINASNDVDKVLKECETVLNQLTTSKKAESAQERQARRDMDVLVRRHGRAVDQADKWGVAGDGNIQRCFASTEEALALGRSSLNNYNGTTKHRLIDIKHYVMNEESILLLERKKQEEAHFDVQRAMLALPDLKRRSTMLEASVALLDIAVRELVSEDLGAMNEAMVVFEGWLDFRGVDGQIHFAAARDGVVVSLDRAKQAVKEAESSVELQTQRVRTAKAEQSAERSRLNALESKLHSLTGTMANLSASTSSSYTAKSAFAPMASKNEINLKPISDAIGLANKKISRARSLVEVPASDWVIMSLMTCSKNKENNKPFHKKKKTPETQDKTTEDKANEGDEDGLGLDEGPFANMSDTFGDISGPDVETAHEAVESAAEAIATAEKLLREGEKRHHSLVGERRRFESQLQSVVERFGGALATAHAAGVADWPEIATLCEDAESSLGYVRQALGETGHADSGAVSIARVALDTASSKVDSVESAIGEAWQRNDQRKAEEMAATDVARQAIDRWKDVVEASEVYELNTLPVVEACIETASIACRNAQLSIKQCDSLPLVVITEDAKKALESVEELERVVATQRISRDHFDEAEQQRQQWKRVSIAKQNDSINARQNEEQMQLRKLRDQLEAVHVFLANKAPDISSTMESFTKAKDAIYVAQEQLSQPDVSVHVVSTSVQSAIQAVETAVLEQTTSNHKMASSSHQMASSSSSVQDDNSQDGGDRSRNGDGGGGGGLNQSQSSYNNNEEDQDYHTTTPIGDQTPPELIQTSLKMSQINEALHDASNRLKDQDRILILQSNVLNGIGDRESQLAELLTFQQES